MQKTYDFLVLGAGIFGITTAIELRQQGYSVAIINPDRIPHPDAASTDISKIVRMEYGSDIEYMKMVEICLEGWRGWNELFNETLYHEVGFTLLCHDPITEESRPFEFNCLKNLKARGHKPERLNPEEIALRFPAFANSNFADGFTHAKAGFAESGRTVEVLTDYFRQLKGKVFENQSASEIQVSNGKVEGVKTKEGTTFKAGNVIVCAGNSTPYLLPELMPYFKITGHPVFHLKPGNPDLFSTENLSVFSADTSKTGWYGFPLHPKEKVVKVALHTEGMELNPETDKRVVYEDDKTTLREFLKKRIPSLANDPLVYTRRCCYTDTLDGHFWIDHHPEIKGLTIGTGGSGHGFKMGPVIGKMISQTALGQDHGWSDRYQWRELGAKTKNVEEARYIRRD